MKFEYEFEDLSENNKLRIDYSENTPNIKCEIIDGVPYLFANKDGLMTVAKMLIKMSLCDYPNGFHIHLGTNFGDPSEAGSAICILLNK